MYALLRNNQVEKYPFSLTELKKLFPNVSFPRNLGLLSNLDDFGVVTVNSVTPPTYDENLEYIEQGTPQFVDGSWEQTWNVVPFTAQELEIRENSFSENVRLRRNELLADSDWTQLADSSADKAAWATYRQALRDLPQQVGFPNNVTWPVAP